MDALDILEESRKTKTDKGSEVFSSSTYCDDNCNDLCDYLFIISPPFMAQCLLFFSLFPDRTESGTRIGKFVASFLFLYNSRVNGFCIFTWLKKNSVS